MLFLPHYDTLDYLPKNLLKYLHKICCELKMIPWSYYNGNLPDFFFKDDKNMKFENLTYVFENPIECVFNYHRKVMMMSRERKVNGEMAQAKLDHYVETILKYDDVKYVRQMCLDPEIDTFLPRRRARLLKKYEEFEFSKGRKLIFKEHDGPTPLILETYDDWLHRLPVYAEKANACELNGTDTGTYIGLINGMLLGLRVMEINYPRIIKEKHCSFVKLPPEYNVYLFDKNFFQKEKENKKLKSLALKYEKMSKRDLVFTEANLKSKLR